MFLRVVSFRLLVLSGAMLAAAVPANAQLAAKSPFMPPQTAANATPTAGAPLEFRGYMETGEGIQYRLYDPAKKIGTWVKLNEKNSDFDLVVKQHDNSQKTLTIEHQGKTLTLAEREAKVVSSGAAAQAIPPPIAPVQSNVSPAVTQAVVLNPTPADEQRRLDAVAAEVARRRALREQATQQINQGVAPQTNMPQVLQAPAQPQGNFQAPVRNYQAPTDPNAQRGRGSMQTAPRQR
jgi:hypothetical protein